MRLGLFLFVFWTISIGYTAFAQVPTDTLKASITNPEVNPNFSYDGFGSAMDIYGDDAIVASALDIPSGKAYTFKKQNGQWIYQRTLTPSKYNPFLGSRFGSVTITNNYFAINFLQSTPNDGTSGTGTTLVDIFKKNDTNPLPHQSIELPSNMTYSRGDFAMNDNFLVIGIPSSNSTDITQQGSIHIYKLSNETWVKDTVFKGPYGFGEPLFLEKNYIVVSDPFNSKIHVFNNKSGIWQKQTAISPSYYRGLNFDPNSKAIITINEQNNLNIFEETDANQWALKETITLPPNSGNPIYPIISGNNVLVTVSPNQIFLFQKVSNNWIFTKKYILDIPNQANLFFSPLAVNNQVFMIGTPNLDLLLRGKVFYGTLPPAACSNTLCIPVVLRIIQK